MNTTKKAAPRIHSLPKLAALADIEADASQIDLMAVLSNYYVQSRYPETVESLVEPVNREQAEAVLDSTQELFEWLLSILK